VGKIGVCYLCGKTLFEPIDRDHVPPRQLFAKDIRKEHSPNLLTIPVHAACNKSYQHDEDYFVNSLAPFGLESYSGEAVLHEALEKVRQGRNVGLHRKVLEEFEDTPSGLVLPEGKIIKRFDGDRMQRVILKIVAGLYFHHYGEVLPQDLTCSTKIYGPDEKPPDGFLAFMSQETTKRHGLYPGVFDYCFEKFPEVNNFHYWAMLLWDKIIMIAYFHDPACECLECKPEQADLRGN
jgi:hypothetical protein